MEMYQVVRSPDYLEHHGILGMKWGVWNDETAARRRGGSRRKKSQKDYSKMSDKKLKRELNRRRQINELREMDRKEKLARSPLHRSSETIKRIGLALAAVSGIFVTINKIKQNAPGVSNSVKEASSFISSFMSKKGNTPVAVTEIPETILAWEYYLKH